MRVRFSLALIASMAMATALGSSPSAQSPPPDLETTFRACANALKPPREREAACTEFLEQGVGGGGGITAVVLALRGSAWMDLHRYERAARDFTSALEIEPSNIGFLRGRARAFGYMGEPDRAIADIDLAIEIAPDEAPLYVSRAIALAELGNMPAAFRDLDTAERLNARDPDVFNIRGGMLMSQQEYEDAILQYDRSIALRPGIGALHMRRGLATYLSGGDALEDFETAITLGHETPDSFLYRAFARDADGDRDGALEDFSQSIDRDPSLPVAWHRRGLIYMDRHDYEQARRDLDVATQINPDSDYLNSMAWLLVAATDTGFRDPQAALDYVTRSIDLDENADNVDTAAAAHALLGNQDEAMSFYIRSMELGGAERVRMYQEYLAERGYYSGRVDGADGPLTRAAIEAFAEKRKVLLVD